MKNIKWLVLGLAWVALIASASQGEKTPETEAQVPEFVPGVFSDNNQYQISDFKGKLLVLFFYEKDCPRCRGMVPDRNAVVEHFRDAPVKFIAVGAGDTLKEVQAYANATHLAMPVFADSLSAMEARFGIHISLNNISQFFAIGPDGGISRSDMSQQSIEQALKDVKWKFKDDGYDPKLAPAINLLEWNQWEAGMRLLRPFVKGSPSALTTSAQKLYDTVKVQGTQWKAEADKLVADKPAAAFDLYVRIANVFANDDLGKSVAEPLHKLRTSKAVTDELAARQMYAQLCRGMAEVKSKNVQEVTAFVQQIVRMYPGTPSAVKAKQFLNDLATAAKTNNS